MNTILILVKWRYLLFEDPLNRIVYSPDHCFARSPSLWQTIKRERSSPEGDWISGISKTRGLYRY